MRMGLGLDLAARRAKGAFNPKSLSPLAWYKANSIVQTDNTAVSTWPDSSNNGRTITQPTSSKQPIFHTGVINGNPTVRFDGIDDNLLSTAAIGSPSTLFFVFSVTNNADYRTLTNSLSSAGLTLRINLTGRIDALASFAASLGTSTNSYPVATPVLLTFTTDASSNIAFFKNGAVNGATASSGFASQPYCIGADPIGVDSFFLGDIGEIIFYDKLLASADRINVENYLRTKWATG